MEAGVFLGQGLVLQREGGNLGLEGLEPALIKVNVDADVKLYR